MKPLESEQQAVKFLFFFHFILSILNTIIHNYLTHGTKLMLVTKSKRNVFIVASANHIILLFCSLGLGTPYPDTGLSAATSPNNMTNVYLY